MNKLFVKITIAIFVFLIFTQPTISQPKKIKREIQKGFILVNNKLVWDSSETHKYYDMMGNIIEEIEKSIWPAYQKLVAYKKKNFHNESGRLDSTLIFTDDKLSMKLVSIYDSLGREAAVQEFRSNGTPGFKTKLIYNSSSKKIKTEMLNPQGQLYNFKNYKYNKLGNMSEESGFQEGVSKYRWTYSYDKKNRLTLRQEFNGQGILQRKRKYEYDNLNMIKQETISNPNGQVERIIKYSYEHY